MNSQVQGLSTATPSKMYVFLTCAHCKLFTERKISKELFKLDGGYIYIYIYIKYIKSIYILVEWRCTFTYAFVNMFENKFIRIRTAFARCENQT